MPQRTTLGKTKSGCLAPSCMMLEVCDYEKRDVVEELVLGEYLGKKKKSLKKNPQDIYHKPRILTRLQDGWR